MYQIIQNSPGVIRTTDGAHIPSDPGNRDWQEYQWWLAAGNAPLPAKVPSLVVPSRVLMHRARLALLDAGLLDAVEAELASLPQPQRRRALIEWEFSPTLDRDHGLVPAMAAALGLTDEQIDGLFLAAGAP